jgi:hypothetical protein
MDRREFNSNGSVNSAVGHAMAELGDPKVLQLFSIIRTDYLQSIKVENYKDGKNVKRS